MKLSKELTIYCDPPYKDTTRAGVSWSFDSVRFVKWCNETAPHVKALYVSEFQALHPSWKLIDAVTVADGLKATSEKLYRVAAA